MTTTMPAPSNLASLSRLLGIDSLRSLIKSHLTARPRGKGNRAARRMGNPPGFQHLKRWSLPDSYAGAEWADYYVFLGRTRDSDELTESNFDKGLELIGGETTAEDGTETPLVLVVREGHWACGWVEWIAIHKTATAALVTADKTLAALEDYPVLDEEDFSRREDDSAQHIWTECYDTAERIQYIRDNRSQFDFHGFADMLGCARGKYFNGYASELIH